MDLSIVVINYNTYDLTVQCIQSIIDFTNGIDYEIILVDNASSFFDKESFQRRFKDIKLIISKENLGFAGGNNLGIEQAIGAFVLLLNSDTYLKDNGIPILIKYLRSHSKAAVVSGRLVYPTGVHQSVCQRFPSIRYSLFEFLRIQKLITKRKGGKILLGAFFDHKENAKADWVWGTFFMFRRSILNELPNKKLDETFFMYCEDMQWCWNFKKLGYEVHYCAEAEIVHLMGASSGNKIHHIQRNSELFLSKNYSFLHRKVISLLRQLL